MTKKLSRVRIPMMPYLDDEDGDSVGYSGPRNRSDGSPSDHQAT
jgi:hypothetical protein